MRLGISNCLIAALVCNILCYETKAQALSSADVLTCPQEVSEFCNSVPNIPLIDIPNANPETTYTLTYKIRELRGQVGKMFDIETISIGVPRDSPYNSQSDFYWPDERNVSVPGRCLRVSHGEYTDQFGNCGIWAGSMSVRPDYRYGTSMDPSGIAWQFYILEMVSIDPPIENPENPENPDDNCGNVICECIEGVKTILQQILEILRTLSGQQEAPNIPEHTPRAEMDTTNRTTS